MPNVFPPIVCEGMPDNQCTLQILQGSVELNIKQKVKQRWSLGSLVTKMKRQVFFVKKHELAKNVAKDLMLHDATLIEKM